MEIRRIGTVQSDFASKFGIPKQSGLVEEAEARIIFEKDFSHPDFLRGLEEFSHIWVIWGFSANDPSAWSPTVRPPKLGGNARVGVFASRSPFRPNSLGLSLVRVLSIGNARGNAEIRIAGADMLNGSPVFDVKPYVPADCRPEAKMSFASPPAERKVVHDPAGALGEIESPTVRSAAAELLSLDPRPAYHDDPTRVYVMQYADFEIRFTGDGAAITVTGVQRVQPVSDSAADG